MKHHYIITGILGRVSGKPASQLFLIARHTHNWAFYRVVQIPALSCNIHKDCVFFPLHMKRGCSTSHAGERAQHPEQGPWAFAHPLAAACRGSAPLSHRAAKANLKEVSPLSENVPFLVNIICSQPLRTKNATAAPGCLCQSTAI